MSVYDFDNTPPVAIALASSSPDNTAPVAIAPANSTPDNTQPVTIALASSSPDNTAPDAIALASSSPDNTPPVAITLASSSPDNTAPTAVDLGSSTPTNEPARARFKPGVSIARPNNETVNTPTLNLEGELVLNQIFGYLRIPAGCALTRLQLQLEEAPVGGPLTVDLIKPDGTLWNISVTVADGAVFGETVLSTPPAFIAGDDIRAKATAMGPTTPGGFGTLTLFTQLA